MQQAQRAEYNHALEFAVDQANALQQPCLVIFGLTDDYPDANLRHYTFMLEGLRATQQALSKRGIKLVVRPGAPDDVAIEAAKDASLIVYDRGYLRVQRQWRQHVSKAVACAAFQVESDVIVPVDIASSKQEYAARTIRQKLQRQLNTYLQPMKARRPSQSSLPLRVSGMNIDHVAEVCQTLRLDSSVPPVSSFFTGGTAHAKRRFRQFLRSSIQHDVDHRNQPQTNDVSHMSPYLHFGHISPLWLALEARKHLPSKHVDAWLEELIIRRELAINFVHYNDAYDTYDALPDWAQQTLREHRDDKREPRYTRDQLENAETHDPYWNAAMREMRCTGYMHNAMRMYWGKQILAWCPSPPDAYQTALYLNNKYFLDGRDPNSFANIGWLFGLHDRPWPEHAVFGKVRRMTPSGLKRKGDPEAYIGKVNRLCKRA
jgi:deoxyribodipyrimidine photo-lyase